MKSVLSVAILLSLPTYALAAWWNPLTWKIPRRSVQPAAIEQAIQQNPQVIEKERIIEKPVIQEKIVTQTVTIDNPELQKKIDALATENQKLRNDYNAVIAAYNNINSFDYKLQLITAVYQQFYKPRFDEYDALIKQANVAMNQCADEYSKLLSRSSTPVVPLYIPQLLPPPPPAQPTSCFFGQNQFGGVMKCY